MIDTNMIDKPYVVGIDIGGQTTKMGIVDMRGQVLTQTVIRTDTHTEVEPYVDDVAEALDKIIKESGSEGKIRGIGIGAPNANYYTGTIENAVNISWGGSKSIPFADLLSARTGGMKVALTNDANAAAVGEMTYGAARGMKNFIMITLGTGVGSGIVINGEVVYGHDGFAGELGHTCAVRNNGRLCNCGKTGCLETYCSATGVARTAREVHREDARTVLCRLRGIQRTGGHCPLRRPCPCKGVSVPAYPRLDECQCASSVARQDKDSLFPAEGIGCRDPRGLRTCLGALTPFFWFAPGHGRFGNEERTGLTFGPSSLFPYQ